MLRSGIGKAIEDIVREPGDRPQDPLSARSTVGRREGECTPQPFIRQGFRSARLPVGKASRRQGFGLIGGAAPPGAELLSSLTLLSKAKCKPKRRPPH